MSGLLAAVLVGWVAATAATGEQASARRPEKAVPFTAGEVLTYDISWAGFLTAGRATLSVLERRSSPSSSVWHVVAEGGPTGLVAHFYTLHYKCESFVDAFTLLPQRGSISSLEGKRTGLTTTTFNHRTGTASYEVNSATTVRQALKIAPLSQDALSVFVAMRATPFRPGSRVTFPVCHNGLRYTVAITTEGRETVKTDAVTAPAWRLNVKVTEEQSQWQSRDVYIWVSDDARRLPMKMKAELPVGSFVFVLAKIAG
jgi:hypothetical protein